MSQETPQSRANLDGWSPPPGSDHCPALSRPTDIVNKDAKSTLRVLYSLFRKHKLKEKSDGVPQGSPN